MNIIFGSVFLLAGLALVFVGAARDGVPRPFLRGNLMELMYPTVCLGFIAMGGAFLVSGLLG